MGTAAGIVIGISTMLVIGLWPRTVVDADEMRAAVEDAATEPGEDGEDAPGDDAELGSAIAVTGADDGSAGARTDLRFVRWAHQQGLFSADVSAGWSIDGRIDPSGLDKGAFHTTWFRNDRGDLWGSNTGQPPADNQNWHALQR